MSKGSGGKNEQFAITTDQQWQLELPIMLGRGTDTELNGI